MNRNLYHVVKTVHLQKDDCNIFLIGEINYKWKKCDSIMFQNLVEYIELNFDIVKIDLMIEKYLNIYKKIKNFVII